jgi:hypothetical protein
MYTNSKSAKTGTAKKLVIDKIIIIIMILEIYKLFTACKVESNKKIIKQYMILVKRIFYSLEATAVANFLSCLS